MFLQSQLIKDKNVHVTCKKIRMYMYDVRRRQLILSFEILLLQNFQVDQDYAYYQITITDLRVF